MTAVREEADGIGANGEHSGEDSDGRDSKDGSEECGAGEESVGRSDSRGVGRDVCNDEHDGENGDGNSVAGHRRGRR